MWALKSRDWRGKATANLGCGNSTAVARIDWARSNTSRQGNWKTNTLTQTALHKGQNQAGININFENSQNVKLYAYFAKLHLLILSHTTTPSSTYRQITWGNKMTFY